MDGSSNELCSNTCLVYCLSNSAGRIKVLEIAEVLIISLCYVSMGLFEIYVPSPLLWGI